MPFITARVVSVIRTDAIAALADAGEGQSVICANILIQLEGQILGDDPANHTFEWEQTAGDVVSLINANTLTPSFFLLAGGTDIEFTFYVDRNTPFEVSDTTTIARTPTTTSTGYPLGSSSSDEPSGLATVASSAVSNPQLLADGTATPSAFINPPAGYSPLYEAEDVNDMRNFLTGNYWLMNDIDLSGYANWNPIGTATKPFSGELQGNGFKIENLSISSDSILIRSADPYIDNVTLMVSGETAADGSTTFTSDVGGKTFDSTVTHVTTGTGVATVSNAQSKFGSNSIYVFDEIGGANNAGFGTTTSTDFDFGSGDFTIEYHWQTPDINVSTRDTIGMWDNSSLGWKINHLTSAALSNWSITFSVSTDGTSNNLTYANAEQYTGALNTWIHIAVSRVGNTMYYFADGNLIGTKDVTGLTIFAGTSKFYLGTATLNGPNYELYMDNVRLTKGVGRYTTSFTPPSNPFPVNDVVGDVGLFSRVGNGAVIENVGVTNANISGVSNTVYKGILAGSAQGISTDDGGTVTVRDCYVSGTVDSGGNQAGGLIGHTGTNVSSIFENTYADVTVTGGGTDTGGWAGTFSGTPTYVENYSNTTKTASVVGTGAPGGTEVSGLTTAQLTAEANYTDWDFTNTWEIDEGVSAATLQEQDTLTIREGTCLDTMVAWQHGDIIQNNNSLGRGIPGDTLKTSVPIYEQRGAIVERKVGNNWQPYVRIPAMQKFFNLAAEDVVRVYWRWRKYGGGLMTQNIETLHPKTFSSIDVAGSTTPKIGGTNRSSGYPYGQTISRIGVTPSITIFNPRRISLSVVDDTSIAYPYGQTVDLIGVNSTVQRLIGTVKVVDGAETNPANANSSAGYPYGLVDAPASQVNLVITRQEGGNIGGG